ncbi:MAG: SPOR domain-containing protein [Patescibacteria group bacterium]
MKESKRTNLRLMRQDDNGNIFQVGKNLTDPVEAQRLLEQYRAKGHKQDYWLEKINGKDPD